MIALAEVTPDFAWRLSTEDDDATSDAGRAARGTRGRGRIARGVTGAVTSSLNQGGVRMPGPPIGTFRQHARAFLAVALTSVAACGSDRGVPEGIAGGYSGGGLGGLTGGCYLNPNPNIPNDGASVITLDAKARYQTMQGFGVSMRLFDDPRVTNTLDPATKRATATAPASAQAVILDALYTDLGLTRVRFLPGDGGIEPVNDNADPLVADLSKFDFSWTNGDGQLDLMPALALRGARTYFAATPALESWMTEANPQEYAEWLLVTLRHWRDRGYEPPYVSLKNEPGSAASGGVWSATYLRDVTNILGARIKADGMKTKIVLPDDVNAREAYARLQVILADPEARQYVGAVAYHLRDVGGELELKQLAEQHGIPIWMTDYSTPDFLQLSSTINTLISEDGVSAVDYTWGFYGDHEPSQLVRLVSRNGAYERFVKTSQYFAVGQYARYVPPGAVRIGATSNDPSVKATAFVDNAKLIVVVTYLGGPYERPVRVELGQGAPCVKRVESVRTSDVDNWNPLPQQFIDIPRISVVVPARSITTFVGQQ
jgi:O-glycosyl hydrolase